MSAPTYRHVNEYLDYMLELALTAVGDKAQVDASNEPVKNFEEAPPPAFTRINFTNGTSVDAKEITATRTAPHMGQV